MQECYIIGCGGHGRQIRNWIDAEGRYKPTGWLDADTTKLNIWVDGLPVMGLPHERPDMLVTFGIGDCAARYKYLSRRRFCINVIHPAAIVPSHVRTDRLGLVIGPYAMIDEADVLIENAVVIHAGAQVHHDCRIGTAAFIGPGAVLCGHCRIGERVMIGANATLKPGITVGDGAIIGAGTTITRDVEENETMIQAPALQLSEYVGFKKALRRVKQGVP